MLSYDKGEQKHERSEKSDIERVKYLELKYVSRKIVED